ncbi:hypothetical protein ACFOY2_15750 [Nonomuraea purpurea]|uniref:Uncharacterized protein n=1 Tax=Nonomuraea purpurea TaxID=1849276 RepID=A0ABV8G6N3_9ACTN
MKLRVEGLEARLRTDRQADLLREIDDRTRRLESALTTLEAGFATARAEMNEQFDAVEVEVAGVRRAVSAPPSEEEAVDVQAETAEGVAAIRSELADGFGCFRSELLDLGIKLDRLMKAVEA